MTTANLFSFVFQVIVIFAISAGICNRDAVIRFERRAWVYIKAFFLALNDVAKERIGKKSIPVKSNVIEFSNYDIAEADFNNEFDSEVSVA
ncbi:MAG: hypothetical protein E7533_00260 [Ruminococcaceae bacterium]|nr:hypothetical protein [Oscillospiraceae bacterium]